MKMSVLIGMMMSFALMTMFFLMNEMMEKKKDKKTAFECGFQPISEKKMTFSTNFLMLMMMFLIFDVEISVLIPFVLMNKNNQNLIYMSSSMLIMLLVLLMLKEWKQGSLEWSK